MKILYCLVWSCLLIFVNCDSLIVNTKSGPVKGVLQRTCKGGKLYRSYRGIPYAEPPIGDLRFEVPIPKKSWLETLDAKEYKPACCVLNQSVAFPLNTTQSEDCLYLNIFVPVKAKQDCLLPVMFFIHGGAYTEGDGQSGYYGPEPIMEEGGVILVTIDYRLGPLGFMNFEMCGLTGNMGLKDQQLGLIWTKRNIRRFGGNPDAITVFGQSAGGVSTHLHVLNKHSRKCINRAICMSGTAVSYFAHYSPNHQLELMYDVFKDELNGARNPKALYKLLKTIRLELLLEKTPAYVLNINVFILYWTPVIENKKIAKDPFLTKPPRKIYQETHIHTPIVFGVTSAELLSLMMPQSLYFWFESLKNSSSIILPFHGLTLPQNSSLYISSQRIIYEFYFGKHGIEQTDYYLNQFVQMVSDIVFVYPFYDAMRLHKNAKTFCYHMNLDLNLNFVKIERSLQMIHGMGHIEEMPYLFHSYAHQELYDNIKQNPNDPKNIQTEHAMKIVPKYFIDFAKSGTMDKCGRVKGDSIICTDFTNKGLELIRKPKKHAMNMLNRIYERVKPWIVDQF
ncbi:juvenile hormone esterase-like [Contarinia nasturtii]|uniref:juvenile hormone esterase-like n=1 Tax=Contarinia nasturtii TaxID=265458 RepID=UPI0012D47A09|nr:juvenile hormone esterase-like [Contarinia nasturtii]